MRPTRAVGPPLLDPLRPLLQDDEGMEDSRRDRHDGKEVTGPNGFCLAPREGAGLREDTGKTAPACISAPSPGRDLEAALEGSSASPPQGVLPVHPPDEDPEPSRNDGPAGLGFRRHNRRNPSRCRRSRVSGRTTTSASFQLNSFERRRSVYLEAESMRRA